MKHSVASVNPVLTEIIDLTHEGIGVAKVDGKTVFIPDVLPGEHVSFVYTSRKRQFDHGRLVAIQMSSPDRVPPRCAHFGVCGGCNLQHLAADKQLQFKQKTLLDNLQRIGHVQVNHIGEPIKGDVWGYRRKARLGCKYVVKKARLLLGFREKNSHYLADLQQCETLAAEVGHRLPMISAALRELSCYEHIPQVEVAVADNATALVIRHLVELTAADRERLARFSTQHGFHIYLQPGGLDSITALSPPDSRLYYRVDGEAVTLHFIPADFIQINRHVNLALIDAVLDALQLDTASSVLELFSGLGNFTLPIARRTAQVVAIEGEHSLVQRARENAQFNNLNNIRHYTADLNQPDGHDAWLQASYQRILLDPPRSGAQAIIPALMRCRAERLVYVSCNPATLARDAAMLVHQYDYRLEQVRILDMFPHTAHVEALAVFTRGK